MNPPDKLAILRVIMIPFFVVCLLWDGETSQILRYVADVVSIAAGLTDMLDGGITRKYNLVTNFGKFMDLLADRLLMCSALICLIELGNPPAWMVIVIISREFIVNGFRLVASDNGTVIAASYQDKFKTASQTVSVVLLIANIKALSIVTVTYAWAALVFTVVPLVDHIAKNHKVLTEGNM